MNKRNTRFITINSIRVLEEDIVRTQALLDGAGARAGFYEGRLNHMKYLVNVEMEKIKNNTLVIDKCKEKIKLLELSSTTLPTIVKVFVQIYESYKRVYDIEKVNRIIYSLTTENEECKRNAISITGQIHDLLISKNINEQNIVNIKESLKLYVKQKDELKKLLDSANVVSS